MQKLVQFRSTLSSDSGSQVPVCAWSLYGCAPTSEATARIRVPLLMPAVYQAKTSADVAGVRRTLHSIFRAVTRQARRVPSTEVRQHFSGAVEWVAETDRPLIVTNHGKPEAVVLSYDVFERLAKGIAQAVLALESRQSSLRQDAEDVLEEEGAALARRFRQSGAG